MRRLEVLKSLPRDRVALITDERVASALLGPRCIAGAIDLELGKCFCLGPLDAGSEDKCVDIRYSYAPVEVPHVVGSLLDALIALSKSFRDRKLIILSLDHSALLQYYAPTLVEGVAIRESLKALKPSNDEDALAALEEANRASRAIKSVVSGSVSAKELEGCTLSIDGECVEAFCSNASIGGYAAFAYTETRIDELRNALSVAIRHGLKDLDLSALSTAIHAALGRLGLKLTHLEYLRLAPTGIAPYIEDGGIEPPDVIGIKLYALRGSKRICLGATIAILSSGEVRIAMP